MLHGWMSEKERSFYTEGTKYTEFAENAELDFGSFGWSGRKRIPRWLGMTFLIVHEINEGNL